MTASVSSDCTVSFCVVRSWNRRRTHSCRSGRGHDLIAARDLDELKAARPPRSRASSASSAARTSSFGSLASSLKMAFGRERLRATRRSALRESPSAPARACVRRAGVFTSLPLLPFLPFCPSCLTSSTVRLRISDGVRRVGRSRAFVDADRAEEPAWNTRTSFKPDHLEQREERHDQPAAVLRVGEQTPSKPQASVSGQPLEQLIDPRSRPTSARAAAASSAGAWRARRRPETRRGA